jgi:ribosomal RNA-processing protein 12
MEEALAKIRPHTSSNIPHQKSPANLLLAIEATLKEQKAEASPTAYFAALLTTLDGTIQRNDFGLAEADILPAELYLLALVSPYVTPTVIRANLETLLSLTAPLFPSLIPHAPALKSQLSLYQSIFLILEKSQIEVQGIRQAFASILQLCLDQRPKVRKKAAEVVKNVLAVPPAPLVRHPYAQRVAIWAKTSLQELSTNPISQHKGKGSDGAESAIHLVSFLRQVLKHLPPDVSSFYFPFFSLDFNNLCRHFLMSLVCFYICRDWGIRSFRSLHLLYYRNFSTWVLKMTSHSRQLNCA